MTDAAPLLDTDQVAFLLQDGMSVNVASTARGAFASLARCIGSRVSADRQRVTVILAATPAAELLTDIRISGHITAVFCLPSSHHTLQLKASDARIEALQADDGARVRRFVDAFVRELEPLGFAPSLSRTLLTSPFADLVAISFTPQAVFLQTPGPNAGSLLAATP